MAIYGNLRDYKFENDADDIRGADVYGVNGEKLGEIDDVIFDSLSGDLKYVVVDTGGWLTTHRFIVPALQLTIREEGDEDYHINLTRDQIERFPEYKEEALASDDEWKAYERDYAEAMETDGVMHMKDSTRIITPEPSPAESGFTGSSPIDPSAATPQRIAHDLPRFGANSPSDAQVTDSGSLVGSTLREPVSPLHAGESVTPSERRKPNRGRRLEDFEERLRKEREEILRRRAA
jgi:sporulation protein YlmC with PRC-barrel domain